MNKQQLASKIWGSANKMRSKIDANEYKDYILGFIFYKFLSDKEEKYFKEQGLTELKELKETNEEYKKYAQKNIGYFISYNDLFSTWLSKGKDFDVSNVRDALARFERLIDKSHEKVFSGGNLNIRIFEKPSEEWAKFVITNRNYKRIETVEGDNNFDSRYDIVCGPIANDDLALLFRQFSDGLISVEILVKEMEFKKLTDQYSFHTEKALSYLLKIGVENV